MAVDDITTFIGINMASGTTTDRQPASGVEEMMLGFADVDVDGTAPKRGPSLSILQIDGTNNDALFSANSGAAANIFYNHGGAKWVADNTRYFRMFHQGGTTGDIAWAVIAIG